MKNRFLPILLILISGLHYTSAQTSKITGKVLDAKSGETLPGTIVMIEGTTQAINTDFDGNYTISNVSPGTYKLVCRLMGYSTKIVSGVKVDPSQVVTVDITIETSSQELNEVVVTTSAGQESVNSMLVMQKNSATVQDGVSAQSIKQTPDKNSSDVLKRVSGTTIQENKFVIVRGLNDRYNLAFINGAPLPSSESDRKAFSFDIFPSGVLDNIIIVKSATPDMPADFSGGVIHINTKNIPDENTYSLSVSAGVNELSTFKKFYTYSGGRMDALGMDDGSRDLPGAIPQTKDFKGYSPHQQADVAKGMPNDWGLYSLQSKPNMSLQYSMSNHARIGKNTLGSLVAVTYHNSYSISRSIRREFQQPYADQQGLQEFELTDSTFSNQVLGSVMANISFRQGENNMFGFKNLYTVNSEDKVIIRNGIREYGQTPYTLEKSSARWFTENRLYSGQLTGEHFIPSKKIKVKWIGGYSDISRNIPNLRRMSYSRLSAPYDPSEPEPVFEASIPTSGTSPTSGGNIFYANNNEKIYSGSYDVTVPLKPLKWLKTELKAGGMHQQRERDFNARQFGMTRYAIFGGSSSIVFDKSLLLLPEDKIFAPENLGKLSSGKGGFKLEETTKFNDSYKASSTLHAAYVMVDQKCWDKLRIVWGARLESFNQQIHSFEDDGSPVGVDTTKTDILPSANLIYPLTERSNLRASYAQTVSRPEFRELAPYGFFDFVTFFTVRGNPKLQRARVHNYDLRYELFPGAGQILSASVFYKKFINAIEQVNSASENRQLDYQNVPEVNSYGAELEFRVNVGTVLKQDSSRVLSGLSLFSNLALIRSEVDASKIPGAIDTKRPLQGQSPYIINAGLQYIDPLTNFGLSVALNRIGRRIAIVGNTQEPDIWEDSRTVLDLQLSKTFYKKIELKVNIKDMLAQDIVFYQDENSNKKRDGAGDNIMAETNTGKTVSVGLSYKF